MPHGEPQWLVQRPNGPTWMKAREYYSLFGRTRAERAQTMEANNLRLRLVPGRPAVCSAPSQAQERDDVYTVSTYQGQLCSCTCADFLRHAVYDDTFACKHMLLQHPQARAAP
jgi:hypothetical protein